MLKSKQKNNGSVLGFTVVLLGIMLITSLGIVMVSLNEKRSASSTVQGSKSFQVTDAGIETISQQILKYQKDNIPALRTALATAYPSGGWTCTSQIMTGKVAGGTVEITFKDKDSNPINCTDTTVIYYIKVVGISSDRLTKRAIETPVCNIRSCEDLMAIENNLSGNYILCSDIDCSHITNFSPLGGIGPSGDETDSFHGVLDGRNHDISFLNFQPASGRDPQIGANSNFAGLFYRISGTVKNLHIKNASVSQALNYDRFGCLASSAGRRVVAGELVEPPATGPVLIENVSCEGNFNFENITGNMSQVGGLIGTVGTGTNGPSTVNITIRKSFFSGTITTCSSCTKVGGSYVGGLVGHLAPSTNLANSHRIEKSFTSGTLICKSVVDYAGGLVGMAIGSTGPNQISDSFSTMNLALSGGTYVGGLIGNNQIAISNTYASGRFSGTASAGTYKNALIGIVNDPTRISNSYYSSEMSGRPNGSYCGPCVPPAYTTNNLTEAQMNGGQTPPAFTGWSTATWGFPSWKTPCLKDIWGVDCS